MKRLMFVAILFVGCKDASTNTPATPARTEATAATQPSATAATTVQQPTQAAKPDRKTVEFVAKTRLFLEEARSAAKLVDLLPGLAEFHKKRMQVSDALTRIPDPPSARFDDIPALAKKISATLEVSAAFLKLASDFLRLKSDASFKESISDAKKAAAEAKAFADEIEKLLPPD